MKLFIGLLVIHAVLIAWTLWLACSEPRRARRVNRRTYHRTLRLAVLSGQITRWA